MVTAQQGYQLYLHVLDSDFMISIQRIKCLYTMDLCTMDFKCRHELILIKFETLKFYFEIPAPD